MNPTRALSVLAARHPARRAFITGAASGLGRALALRLVQPAGRTAPISAYLMRQGASLSWST